MMLARPVSAVYDRRIGQLLRDIGGHRPPLQEQGLLLFFVELGFDSCLDLVVERLVVL
jgi:hypothetical protein